MPVPLNWSIVTNSCVPSSSDTLRPINLDGFSLPDRISSKTAP